MGITISKASQVVPGNRHGHLTSSKARCTPRGGPHPQMCIGSVLFRPSPRRCTQTTWRTATGVSGKKWVPTTSHPTLAAFLSEGKPSLACSGFGDNYPFKMKNTCDFGPAKHGINQPQSRHLPRMVYGNSPRANARPVIQSTSRRRD